MEQMTDTCFEQEGEIDLKDLLYYVFRHWRVILLSGIIVCLLAGGIEYFRMKNQTPEAGAEEIKMINEAQYQDSKDLYEKQIQSLSEAIERENQYKTNSVLLNMDPHNYFRNTITYYISTNYQILPENVYQTPDKTPGVLKAYMAAMHSNVLYQQISDSLGRKDVDPRYAQELVSITSDTGTSMLQISVLGGDQQMADTISGIVKSYVGSLKDKISGSVSEHSISIISDTKENLSDIISNVDPSKSVNTVQNAQKGFNDQVKSLQDNLSSVRESLKKLEKPENESYMYQYKYPIVGGFGGSFLIVIIYVGIYFLSGTLKTKDEIEERLGVMVLGIQNKTIKGKWLSFIDSGVMNLFGYGKLDLESAEEFGGLMAANIQLYTKREESILAIGTLEESKLRGIVADIQKALGRQTIQIGGDILKNSEALAKVMEVEDIILLEEIGVSRIQDIKEEVNKIRKSGKKIVGMVLL